MPMSVKRIIAVFVTLVLTSGFMYFGAKDVVNIKDSLEFQKVELNSKQSEIKELNVQYEKLNTQLDKAAEQKGTNQAEVEKLQKEKQQLEKQKEDLEAQLQARIKQKNNLALASEKAIRVATRTGVASAQSGGNVQDIIIAAANKHGVSSSHMLNIARCESTFDPRAENPKHVYVRGKDYGTAKGLFQFIDNTWSRMSKQAGYNGASVWDATANANVTAWAFAHGHQGEWECH